MGNRLDALISSGLFPDRPAANTMAFKRWVQRLIDYRLNEVPLTVDNQLNIYVSNSGDDANSGTSTSIPIRTLTRLNSIISSSGSIANTPLRINLRRGDRFVHSGVMVGISGTNIHGLRITSYDDDGARATGLPPVVSSFWNVTGVAAAGSGWVAGLSGSYFIGIAAAARPINWLKQDNSHLTSRTPNVLTEVTGLTHLYSVTGSWMYQNSTNLLHAHFYNNADPSTVSPEAVFGDQDNINIRASDGVRVEDIITEGGGVANGDNGYGTKISMSGAQSAVLKQVGSFYNGTHGIAIIDSNAGTSGFIGTFVNCYGGLMRPATNGETFFIAYANKGSQEYIFYRNTGLFGTMRGSGTQLHTARGQNIYAHTEGEISPPSLGIAFENATVLSGSYQNIPFAEVTALQDFNPIATISGGTVSGMKAFIIDEIYDFGDNDSSNGQYLNLGAVVAINPRWKLNLKSSTTPEIHTVNNAAVQLQQYWINPRIEVRLWSGAGGNFTNPSLFNTSANNVIFNIDIYNGQIDYFTMSGAVATGIAGTTWDRSAGAYYTGLVGNSGYSPGWTMHNVRCYNTLMQTFTSGVAIRSSINLANKPPVSGVGGVGRYYTSHGGQSHNAYYGFPSGDISVLTNSTGFFYGGYSNSTGYVTLTGYIRTERVPHSGYTSLYNMAGPLPGSISLEYDHRWHKRQNNVIGPFDNVGPVQLSGLRIYDIGRTGVATFDLPIEKDIVTRFYRKGDRTFTTTLLSSGNSILGPSGFTDSSDRRQGRYLYTVGLTDAEGNTYASGAYLNIGAIRDPLTINSAYTSNQIHTISRGGDYTSSKGVISQNIDNKVVELDNSLYTFNEVQEGGFIDIDDRIYDQVSVTGTFLVTGVAQRAGSTFKTPGGSSNVYNGTSTSEGGPV